MTKFHMTKFHNLVKDTETISTNVTALQEANKQSPLLLSFSSPFLLRPVSPPACLPSPIAKQLESVQQEPRLASDCCEREAPCILMKTSENKKNARNLVFSQFLGRTNSVFKVLHQSQCRHLNLALHYSAQFEQVHTGAEKIYF